MKIIYRKVNKKDGGDKRWIIIKNKLASSDMLTCKFSRKNILDLALMIHYI